jgi:hypothetical protein
MCDFAQFARIKVKSKQNQKHINTQEIIHRVVDRTGQPNPGSLSGGHNIVAGNAITAVVPDHRSGCAKTVLHQPYPVVLITLEFP